MSEEQLVADEPDGSDSDAAWDAWTQRARARRTRGPRLLFLLVAILTVVVITLVTVLLLRHGSGSSTVNNGALPQVQSARTTLSSHQRNCPAGNGQLDCRRSAAGALSLAYRDFNVDLDGITMAPEATDARDLVEEDAELLSNAYAELAVARSNSTYDEVYAREQVAGLRSAFDRHYAALEVVLRTG
ncbi:MAG: hypothetical protein ACJ735_13070 [Actinomycetes bacterium]